jgi:phosphate transport system permease protein
MDSKVLLLNEGNLKLRKIKNYLMILFCVISTVVTIFPLVYIFFYTTGSGISAINLDFFINLPKPVGEAGGGMVNAIVGTLILIGIGSIFGIPIGILAGIYVSEYSGSIMSNIVKFLTDVLS